KLIVHAPTRLEAIERMKRALLELRVEGVDTSVPFHLRVMDEADFRAGRLDIRYLENHEAELLGGSVDEEMIRAAALAAALLEEERRTQRSVSRPQASTSASGGSAWRNRAGWSRG
ncbi:MAG TPA: hypothetical protein VF613_19900, partial [Longimicrobium sp.]